MRIVLIGAAGQLGSDLAGLLKGDLVSLSHREIELSDDASVTMCLEHLQPDVVINTAAYNLVDRAETETSIAFDVNALGPRHLASYCGQNDVTLVHFSTDYVFGLDSERQEPYAESDLPGPLGVYGATKLLGEYFVRSLCPRHFVLRTCGLYGVAGRRGGGKGNFIETMLRLANERPELRVVNDQVCTPTATADLAQAVVDLLQTNAFGLYHATNSGQTTWYELATEALRRCGLATPVSPISTAEFGSKARRPHYSVLDGKKLTQAIGYTLPPWQEALDRYLIQRSLD